MRRLWSFMLCPPDKDIAVRDIPLSVAPSPLAGAATTIRTFALALTAIPAGQVLVQRTRCERTSARSRQSSSGIPLPKKHGRNQEGDCDVDHEDSEAGPRRQCLWGVGDDVGDLG